MKTKIPHGHFVDPNALGLSVGAMVGDDEVLVLCPFHADSNPSAEFNLRKGLLFCFSCGAKADIDQLVEELDGEIVFTTSRASLRLERSDEKWQEDLLRQVLSFPVDIESDYLMRRRVHPNLIERFEIRTAENFVAFPMRTLSGDIVGAQLRFTIANPGKRYVFVGDRLPLWPFDDLAGIGADARIVLVEGIFGALRARRSGVRAFATMSSTALHAAIRSIYGFQNLMAVMDNDDAGFLAATKLAMLGIRCAVNPIEADEATPKQWRLMMEDRHAFSNDPHIFASKTTDPELAIRLGQEFRQTIFPVRRVHEKSKGR